MFTGLIREVGTIIRATDDGTGRRLQIAAPGLAGELERGDSVSVNGACLTVETLLPDGFEVYAGAETCARTTLGRLALKTPVNLEPALRAGEALGGHLVMGHVDGIGRLIATVAEDETVRMVFEAPTELLADLVPRGSVAVDGISLTITAVTSNTFEVAIIPFTWRNTNLCRLASGHEVNIETDILAKYVRRVLQGRTAAGSGITEEFLREHGYL
ncbi:MAG: riboflavin synthase [Armatimonadetes bacterium]|nr:riboflavin synthase [Armatimonadota bacterium]